MTYYNVSSRQDGGCRYICMYWFSSCTYSVTTFISQCWLTSYIVKIWHNIFHKYITCIYLFASMPLPNALNLFPNLIFVGMVLLLVLHILLIFFPIPLVRCVVVLGSWLVSCQRLCTLLLV